MNEFIAHLQFKIRSYISRHLGLHSAVYIHNTPTP